MTDPRVSNECSANREVDTHCHFTQLHCFYFIFLIQINAPLPVSPGSSELFVLDNGGADLRGVCGTFSWDVRNADGTNIVLDSRKERRKENEKVGR